MKWEQVIYDFITYTIFIYSVTLLLFYLMIAFFSTADARFYIKRNSFTDYKTLVSSQHVPSISLLAPAYNEGATIIENVRSLLSVYYSNLEVVIINDGSKDDTLDKLISAYDLVKVDYFVTYQIPSKKVRGVYKSRNPVYRRLVIVDKMNGGKADALNVGVNIASNDYIVCIDVDCVLEQDALLKLIKPFMEETKVKVIATGGVIRVANSCVIEHGRLLKVNMPEEYLPRMQVLEYIRAFLLGRMAWSRLNGLLLISGAFGLFRRDVAMMAGGYSTQTVGEDMELVVRMRVYMHERNLPYKVVYIPDPLCWTEAPATFKVLGRQRNRWARGTFETLKTHKKMFLNPRYGLMGMLSYPFWFFFEWLTPFVEVTGILFFGIQVAFGLVDSSFFLASLLALYSFSFTLSMYALFAEEYSFYRYTKKRDISKMILTALLEPVYFHPRTVYWSLKGNLDLLKGKKSWGDMTRAGFTQSAESEVTKPVVAP